MSHFLLDYNEWDYCPVNDCNGNGFCVSATECRCDTGYYGFECDKAVKEEVPSALETFRILLSIGFFATSVLSITGLVLAIRKIKDTSSPSSRIRTAVFGIVSCIAVVSFFVVAVDPVGQHDHLPNYIFKIMIGMDEPLAVVTFLGVLLHWFELVQMSKRKIKHENMLKQINANYPGKSITVEDMIESVKFLNKFRIPFFVVASFTIIFSVACDFFTEVHIYPLTFNCLHRVYFVMIWIAMTVGYFLIRRKLVDLMPYQISSQVRKLTFRVAILCGFNLVIFIIFSTLELTATPDTAGSTLAIYVIERFLVIANCVVTCTTFLHLRRGFPFFTVSASSSFGSSGRSKSTATHGSSNFSSELVSLPA